MFRKPKSPETIPTIFGWANPATGELLVSIKGLPNPVTDFVLGVPYRAAPVQQVITPALVAEKIITQVEPEVKENIEETEKKVAPRKRK